MTFGEVWELAKAGSRIRRTGWNGPGQYVWLERGFEGFQPVNIIRNAQGQLQPGWLPSMGDLMADDWETCDPTVGGLT